ncbi:MAG: hypothetical protein DRI61_09000 [Chloroflexi bacterium]|nr:MAG: hypothetical protein DRI61_09000 [Chloroflexota bacterium]
MSGGSAVRVSILFDNFSHDKRFKAGWGFSALLEVEGKRILFDTGPHLPEAVLKSLKVNLREIDAVVISHLHQDHYGGVEELLIHAPGISLYAPGPIPPDLKASWQLLSTLNDVREPLILGERVWLTGPIGTKVPEMALLAQTPKGLLMLVGCAHPGIVELARRSVQITGKSPDIIVGGLHLMGLRPRKIRQVAEELKLIGVKRITGCHCTGKAAIKVLREVMGPVVTRGGIGKTEEFS